MGPLILIFLGTVFLLQNTGVLPSTFWLSLWRLWPLILILAGVELMFAHRLPWFGLAVFGAVILAAGAFAIRSPQPMMPPQAPHAPQPPLVNRTVATELNGANQAQVNIRYGAGRLQVDPLPDADASRLALMSFDGPDGTGPVPRYTVGRTGLAQLTYDLDNGDHRFPFGGDARNNSVHIQLNPHVPLTSLSIQTGATDAHLDLGQLQLRSLDLSLGAATAWVGLPSVIDGTSTVHVSGGAATLTLQVPEGVAASIRHRGGLTTLNVNTTRFPQVSEGMYRSPDYDSAARRLDISLETGLTTIQVS